jgi:colanic acid/amylovoran biosynthesis protein
MDSLLQAPRFPGTSVAMKTISVVGVTGFRNRGVEALVRPIVSRLLNDAPNDVINVYSRTPDFDCRRIEDSRVRFQTEGNIRPTFTRAQRIARRLGLAPRGRIEGWHSLLASDLVVFTGGDCLSAEYGDSAFEHHFAPLRVAKKAGIPYVLYAQSIGRFGTANQRTWWNEVSEHAAHVSVRERKTFAYLVNDLGFPRDRLSLTADPAFMLEASDAGIALAETLRISGRPLVGVSLSRGIASWAGMTMPQRISTWEHVLRWLIDELKAHVVLIPHVQETYADDSSVCLDVWKRLGFSQFITVLAGDFSASEYKGMLARCDLVIAERMHAGIAALSSGVPTALVAYSVKARGIMQEMVGADHSLGKALIEATDFGTPQTILAQIEQVWESRDALTDALHISVPTAKALALDGLSGLRRFMA